VQIILVSGPVTRAKTLTIMPRHVLMAVLGLVVFILGAGALMSWLSVQWRLPVVQDLIVFLQMREDRKHQEYMQNNLQMMANNLGELQAKVLQLDGQAERLAVLAGTGKETEVAGGRDKAKPAKVDHKAGEASRSGGGQGGPFIAAPLEPAAIAREIEQLNRTVDNQADEFTVLEARLLERKVRERLLPTAIPVPGATIGSGFGSRNDPILGLRAMHEGIDFNAETGTPVGAAAAGVVQSAEWHPEFGNVIDIDHGEGLTSRYAHLSKVNVKPGQLIRRGEVIGAVGSTGRSTGAHLHFEVRMLGVAQDPAAFLRRNSEFALLKRR